MKPLAAGIGRPAIACPSKFYGCGLEVGVLIHFPSHRQSKHADWAAVTEPLPALPEGYGDLLEQLKLTIAAARWHAQRVVNTELLRLYSRLGNAVLARQREEGWGTRVIDRLATDLRAFAT